MDRRKNSSLHLKEKEREKKRRGGDDKEEICCKTVEVVLKFSEFNDVRTNVIWQ